MLNLLHQFLVLLEQEDNVPFYRFARWGSRKARGTIGKMLAMGLIESQANSDEKYYTLTQDGQIYLDGILKALRHIPKKWDRKWHLLINYQHERLWGKIRDANLFLLHDGVWFSPTEIPHFTKKALIIEVNDSPATSELKKSVRTDETLANQYHRWIKEVNLKLAKITKSRDRDFVLKKFILEYALIKKGDVLPLDFLPDNWPGQKAHNLYQELRHRL